MRSMDDERGGAVEPTDRKRTGLKGRAVLASACGVLLTCASLPALAQYQPAVAAQPPMALGVIVKLKDGSQASGARSMPLSRPSDSAQSQRLRVAAAAQRKRVSFLVQKQAAFGAHVLHNGHPTALADAEAEAARLRQDPDVDWAVPNEILKPAAVSAVAVQTTPPTGNYANNLWLKSRVDSGPGTAGFKDAWTTLLGLGATLTPVVTAVLDTGVVDLTHPDTDSSRLLPGYDFVSDANFSRDGNGRDSDPSDPGDWLTLAEKNGNPGLYGNCDVGNSTWHGTSVTSVLSAPSGSTVMGPGVLAAIPGQVILPVRIGGTCGAATSDILDGMLWAAGLTVSGVTTNPTPARVISVSFGSISDCLSNSPSSSDFLYRNTIATLRAAGVLVVASAGNGDGNSGYTQPSRPASCQGVVAATGLRLNGRKASYANLVNGTRAAEGFFGVAVMSGDDFEPLELLGNTGTQGPGTTQLVSGLAGTSFAAPQVAGVAAMMLAVNPSLNVEDVALRLMTSSTTFPTGGTTCEAAPIKDVCTCSQSTCGAGVLDAVQAIAAAQQSSTEDNAFPAVALRSTSSGSGGGGGGGGGGSSDSGFLLTLAAAAGWLLRRRVVDHVGRITSGKP